jgi:hypothetical protein
MFPVTLQLLRCSVEAQQRTAQNPDYGVRPRTTSNASRSDRGRRSRSRRPPRRWHGREYWGHRSPVSNGRQYQGATGLRVISAGGAGRAGFLPNARHTDSRQEEGPRHRRFMHGHASVAADVLSSRTYTHEHALNQLQRHRAARPRSARRAFGRNLEPRWRRGTGGGPGGWRPRRVPARRARGRPRAGSTPPAGRRLRR